MTRRFVHLALLVSGLASLVYASAQQPAQGPTSEQVFKNITVFKGVPADDLIPAMEFMAASLHYECDDCHNPQDFSAETRGKEIGRKMILMQRDINKNNFAGRLEVTCMTCHREAEKPLTTPVPAGASLRHPKLENAPKPEDLFAKHLAAVGSSSATIVRTGTMTAPNDATHKVETKPLEFIVSDGGKFKMTAGDRAVGSDGQLVWYGANPMGGEPANIFGRVGRTWREADFKGLEKPTVSGTDKIGKANVIVVRATRPATTSTEELYFDTKTGLLVRLVNVRRSTLGSVVTVIDYSNYKPIGGVKVPMSEVVTYAGDVEWKMNFKTAKTISASDVTFKPGGGSR